MLPLDFVLEEPDRIATLPPVPSLLDPVDKIMDAPSSIASAVRMPTSPALFSKASPVDMLIEPVSRPIDVPVPTVRDPLKTDCRSPTAVWSFSPPEARRALLPVITLIFPPVVNAEVPTIVMTDPAVVVL